MSQDRDPGVKSHACLRKPEPGSQDFARRALTAAFAGQGMGFMRIQILVICLVALAGCGGGEGGAAPPPAAPAPPPVVPPPPPPPPIGASGGTITEASGASIIIPAGALITNTTIRIARDSTGAPA